MHLAHSRWLTLFPLARTSRSAFACLGPQSRLARYSSSSEMDPSSALAAKALSVTKLEAQPEDRIDTQVFRSTFLWRPPIARGVFGGQVIGQALRAALQTVSPEFPVHSLHSYFLLPGNPDVPIEYHVRKVRDGRSFVTRSVEAHQQGKAVFIAEMSFHKEETSKMDHQVEMPDVPGPEGLPSLEDLVKGLSEDKRTPDGFKPLLQEALSWPFPLSVRYIDPPNIFKPEKKPPKQYFWVKAHIPKGEPHLNSELHACATAFASDWGISNCALFPLGLAFPSPFVKQIISLDHSMWFHHSAPITDWMLYECESSKSANCRSLNFGRLYDKNGKLIISVAQEALIRLLPPYA